LTTNGLRFDAGSSLDSHGSNRAGASYRCWGIAIAYTRWSESAKLGTTKDRRKIGEMLFPLHRKATVSPSVASNVLVRLEFLPLRTCSGVAEVEQRHQEVRKQIAGDENAPLLDQQRRMAGGVRLMLESA
jgi:hypothetical protein